MKSWTSNEAHRKLYLSPHSHSYKVWLEFKKKKKFHLWPRTESQSLQSQWNLFKKFWGFPRGLALAWKHAQASTSHQQTLWKILWKCLGENEHESNAQNTFWFPCVTSRQLMGTNLLPRNQPETSRDTRHQGMSSDTLSVFLKDKTKWNQSFGMGRKASVLTPRTHTCRYLEDKKPNLSLFGPHSAGVRPLSWFWGHHNEGVKQTPQGADRFQWPQTRPIIPVKSHCWNPMYKISAVNIASVMHVLCSGTIHCYHFD